MRLTPPKIIYFSIYLVSIAWVVYASLGFRDSPFFLASMLGLTAFTVMWVHFFNGLIRDAFFPESDTKTLYKITRYLVSFCLIAHPVLISYYLIDKGYGLPPFNYSNFFGATKALFVYLGILSLGIFIAFDFKGKLSKKTQTILEHLSNFAMIAITMHALVLGYVLKDSTNRVIFYIIGVTLLLMIGKIYMAEKKKVLSIIGILAVIVALIVVSFLVLRDEKEPVRSSSTTQESSSENQSQNIEAQPTTTTTSVITLQQLSAKNGKNGEACWVAIDGKVYNLTDSSKWVNGEHTTTSGVECGNDLSEKIKESPHGKSTLSKYPIVGSLQ